MPNNSIIPLHQSQLYKLTSPRRLADVLGLAEAELRAMAIGPDRYRQFEIEKKSGGKRPVEATVATLKRVTGRIAKKVGRASWRARLWHYVESSVVARTLKKK